MVSLFGRGFDSLQLHTPSKFKPLIPNGLAAFLCRASPSVMDFGDAFGDAKWNYMNPNL